MTYDQPGIFICEQRLIKPRMYRIPRRRFPCFSMMVEKCRPKWAMAMLICALISPRELVAQADVDQPSADRTLLNSYLDELTQKARALNLDTDRTWLALIHYKPNRLLSGHTSEVDDGNFFLSDRGKTDPGAELEATLAAFFSRSSALSSTLSPQCRFVARFNWLNRKLNFDPSRISIETCPKFEDFRRALNVASINVIFPSTHPNSPASMYGHTSMLMDKMNQTTETRMLAYTVNYAAQADEENFAKYAIWGLFGGFKGQYNIVPYYEKQREWAQLENRDIWEYKLDLKQDQIDFILMHAYELSATYFDYYFFKENCSYHLLSLIEVSMPDEGLTEAFTGWTIPVDTLRELNKKKLIMDVTYYPSLGSVIEHRRSMLTKNENKLAMQVFNDGMSPHKDELDRLPEKRRVMVLDMAYEYLRYNKFSESDIYQIKLTEREREVLLARSKIPIASDPIVVKPPEVRPDQGHDTARVSVGAGRLHNSSFAELSWRATYHDLLDPRAGYVPNSQLEFFNLRGRYYDDDERLEVHSLKLIDIISLEPRDDFFRHVSWHVSTGWSSAPKEDDFVGFYTVDGGGGFSYAVNADKRTIVYGFVDSQLNYGKPFVNKYALGVGISAGLLSEITDQWNVHLFGSKINGVAGDKSDVTRFSLEQGVSLVKNLSLRLTTSRLEMFNQRSREILAQVHVYY